VNPFSFFFSGRNWDIWRILMGVNGILMGYLWDFMGIYADSMGDLMGI